MKSSIRHGAVVRCDMITVSDDGVTHRHECDVTFISYSVASIVREQATGAGWVRPKTGRVKWPGNPPFENAKKVDLCPTHAKLVMTDEEIKKAKDEAKAKRKAERELAAAEKAKRAKRPRVPRKKKAAAPAEATA